jgi:Phosphoesterase family/PKD domain
MLVGDKNRGASMLRARSSYRPRSFTTNPVRRLRLEPLEDRVLLSGDIHTIQHVIVIMQENRSFDSYFGTYPGADGIPMKNGVPTVSVFDPLTGTYQSSYHDPSFRNTGGPHDYTAAMVDMNGGQMNGFDRAFRHYVKYNSLTPDVMGYHDRREIPNYWSYADHFVLQDHMFSPAPSWSLPMHQLMVSAWAASSSNPYDPMSSVTDLSPSYPPATPTPTYAWTDLTYLLSKFNVSWGYYSEQGNHVLDPDDGGTTPSIWNPLPYFTDVWQDNQLNNVQDASNYFAAAAAGTLPQVSWVVPNANDSEHPASLVNDGQAWVTSVVNAAMKSPDWNSTAIFLSWDDWGGFYDHVVPPVIGGNQFGLRTPGLVISPWAKPGYIDHQTLSFDAYLKFIEDDFLGGQRLDPKTDGRPDSRPNVREAANGLGNLVNDFDFSQTPRGPLILAVRPNSPTADPGGPYVIHPGDSLTLDASASSDPFGKPLTFSWDVNGDGAFRDTIGVNPTKTWQDLVKLGIKDNQTYHVRVLAWETLQDFTFSGYTTLTVEDAAPGGVTTSVISPIAGSDFMGIIGSFAAASLGTAPGDYLATITWGDGQVSSGTISDQGKGRFVVRASHVYADKGVYHLTLTVRHGSASAYAATDANVSAPPVLLPPPDRGTNPVGDGPPVPPAQTGPSAPSSGPPTVVPSPGPPKPGTGGGASPGSNPPTNVSNSGSLSLVAANTYSPTPPKIVSNSGPTSANPDGSSAPTPNPSGVVANTVASSPAATIPFRAILTISAGAPLPNPEALGTAPAIQAPPALIVSPAPVPQPAKQSLQTFTFDGAVAVFPDPKGKARNLTHRVTALNRSSNGSAAPASSFFIGGLSVLDVLIAEPRNGSALESPATDKRLVQRAFGPSLTPSAVGGQVMPDLLSASMARASTPAEESDLEGILLGMADVSRTATMLELDEYFGEPRSVSTR